MSDLAQRLFPVAQEQLTSDDFYTPAWVFQRMDIEFDLDVCSPPGGVPWIPAARFYTQADDGLASPWEGRVWMNPPYSNPAPWVERFVNHKEGIALVPHCRARWHSLLWATADALADPNPADGPLFQFLRNGMLGNSFLPVVMAAFGDECVEAISRLGVVRKVVA